ncbi:MAG: PspC domain-containing protein [Candidatus Limnocylindrales bacterium]
MDERLYRSRSDRIISGVAAGLADRLDIDPSIVRVVWALLVLPTGFLALLAYIVMAIVVPEEPYPAPADRAPMAGMTPPPATPGAAYATPASSADGAAGMVGSTPPDASSGPAPVEAAGTAGPTGPGWIPPLDWRAQRRAERRAWRAAHHAESGHNGALVFGAILIVVGAVFLVRQFVPQVDFDLLWPSALIALGVVLILAAFRRA